MNLNLELDHAKTFFNFEDFFLKLNNYAAGKIHDILIFSKFAYLEYLCFLEHLFLLCSFTKPMSSRKAEFGCNVIERNSKSVFKKMLVTNDVRV